MILKKNRMTRRFASAAAVVGCVTALMAAPSANAAIGTYYGPATLNAGSEAIASGGLFNMDFNRVYRPLGIDFRLCYYSYNWVRSCTGQISGANPAYDNTNAPNHHPSCWNSSNEAGGTPPANSNPTTCQYDTF